MVANGHGPRSLALAGALRQARESHVPKISLNAHARALGVSPSVVSYWETGKRIPNTENVSAYLQALGITGERRDNILDLARGAAEPNWLPVGIPGISQSLAGVLECERNAVAVTEWSIGAVPGLLQTADYAREIIGRSPDAEAKVALRLSRRDALTRQRPLRLTALLSEMALRQVIGGPEVMADQLRYLLKMAKLKTVTLQVVPIGEGWHPGLAGPFVLYSFAQAPSILHLEHHRAGAFVYDEEDVKAYKEAADKVREMAMSPSESAGLIASVVN
jgi:transcriptional regulator with XRE-family HTH domain